MWYIHIIECYLAKKWKSYTLQHAISWNNCAEWNKPDETFYYSLRSRSGYIVTESRFMVAGKGVGRVIG